MSVRLNGSYPTRNNIGLSTKGLLPGYVAPVTGEWVRNPSWPACEAPAGSNMIVGLHAVYPGDGTGAGGNFFAFSASSAGSTYTVNYGDGTTANYASGSTAYYEFDYNDADLAGTNAPVTFTGSTDTVNRTAHGYTDGMTVRFYNIVTTTGLSQSTPYYVINATADTFQVSATSGGSAIALTNDGSATLLPYKIATVTITPQAGQTFTSVNFYSKHNTTGLVDGYSTGWLDIAIAGASITSLAIGSSGTSVRHLNLERVLLNQLGNIASFANSFRNCHSLRSIEIDASITTVTDMNSMFSGCYSLTSVPALNTTAVTSMASMFSNCYSLTSVPLFNTAAVTNMSSMFSSCYSLTSVPLFNTAVVTNMSNMFSSCYSLTSVPALNTTAVASSANLSGIFTGCNSLARIQAKDFKYTFSVANCKLSAAALNEIYTNLPTVTGQTITVTGNYGTAGDDPTIATAKGWTVTG